jgi:hypothetical protein
VLADKPDYYLIQDEISKSLFEITDGQKQSQTNSGQNDSDEDDD